MDQLRLETEDLFEDLYSPMMSDVSVFLNVWILILKLFLGVIKLVSLNRIDVPVIPFVCFVLIVLS